MGESTAIREGATVKRTCRIASIKVGEGILGRVVNTLGEPIDGKGPVEGETFEMPLERKAPGVIFREPSIKRNSTMLVSRFTVSMLPLGKRDPQWQVSPRPSKKKEHWPIPPS